MSDNKHRHIGQLSVERFLLGELSELEKEIVLRSMEECEVCASAVATTREDEKAFALKPVTAEMRDLWLKQEPRSGPLGKILAIMVPVAAAAAVALVIVLGQGAREIPQLGNRAGDDVVRTMGGDTVREFELGFYIRKGDENLLGNPGQKLKYGDRIQF